MIRLGDSLELLGRAQPFVGLCSFCLGAASEYPPTPEISGVSVPRLSLKLLQAPTTIDRVRLRFFREVFEVGFTDFLYTRERQAAKG